MKFLSRLAAAFITLSSLTAGPTRAEEQNEQYLLSSKAYDVISEVRGLMEQKNYSQAESRLISLPGTDSSAYDRAVTRQTLGYIYIEMDRLDQATSAFMQSLEGNALPQDVSHNINFIIAQLLANAGKYKESLNYLTAWLAKEPNPEPQAHLLAASVYYQLEDYHGMIPHAQQAIAKSSKPEQNWYEMLLAGYIQLNDYTNAAELLERMISRYPDKDVYWKQLAGTYQLLKQYNKALALYELALKKNILDETEIVQLAQLYLTQEVPYKAGSLLDMMMNQGKVQRNTEHLELLANSWLLAKEYQRATNAYSELAKITNDPDLYYRIGQIHFEREQWSEAMAALELAVTSGQARYQAEAWLLLGIAAYHNNDNSRSAQALQQAVNFNNTRSQAQWWLTKLNDRAAEKNS